MGHEGVAELILTSQAYQQSSRFEEAKREKDPDNRLVGAGRASA